MTIAITYNMPVSVLGLTKRVRTTLDRNRVQTVGELVGHLGDFGGVSMVGARQVSEITEALRGSALPCSPMLTPRQLSALCELSRSTFFAFDVFGRLFSVNQRTLLGGSRVCQTMGGDALICDLPLPVRLKRALIQAGITKMGQAVVRSDEELHHAKLRRQLWPHARARAPDSAPRAWAGAVAAREPLPLLL